jgi:hypothetical protein
MQPMRLDMNRKDSSSSMTTSSSSSSGFSFGSSDILFEQSVFGLDVNHDATSLSKVRPEDFNALSLSSSVRIPDDAFRKVKDGNKIMFACTWKNCNSKFTRRAANCRAHWIRHSNNLSPFTCEKCKIGFRRNADFKRHIHQCYNQTN